MAEPSFASNNPTEETYQSGPLLNVNMVWSLNTHREDDIKALQAQIQIVAGPQPSKQVIWELRSICK